MDKNRSDFPEKKDLIYWMIIIFLALVTVIVWRVDSPKTLTEQISLGAALFSILLAVVGIIIPYIQGNETNRQNFKILGEINRVSENLVHLNSLKDEMAKQLEEQAQLSKQYSELINSTTDKLQKSTVDNEELTALKEIKIELENNIQQLNYEKSKIYNNKEVEKNKNRYRVKLKPMYMVLSEVFGERYFTVTEATDAILRRSPKDTRDNIIFMLKNMYIADMLAESTDEEGNLFLKLI